jgi:hypothetical protein
LIIPVNIVAFFYFTKAHALHCLPLHCRLVPRQVKALHDYASIYLHYFQSANQLERNLKTMGNAKKEPTTGVGSFLIQKVAALRGDLCERLKGCAVIWFLYNFRHLFGMTDNSFGINNDNGTREKPLERTVGNGHSVVNPKLRRTEGGE